MGKTAVAKLANKIQNEKARLERELLRADEMIRRGNEMKRQIGSLMAEIEDTLDDLSALDEAPETAIVLQQARAKREAKGADTGQQ